MNEGGQHAAGSFPPGHGQTLDEAFKNAWQRAKEHGNQAGRLKVVDIFVEGNNPISGYGVILGPE